MVLHNERRVKKQDKILFSTILNAINSYYYKSVMNFGMNLKEKALALIPSKEQVKDFGKKVGGFVKGLFKDKNEHRYDATWTGLNLKNFTLQHKQFVLIKILRNN